MTKPRSYLFGTVPILTQQIKPNDMPGEYKNMKVKPIAEIIPSHRENVKVALDAVQSKLKPLNQSISILKDEEHEMKVR